MSVEPKIEDNISNSSEDLQEKASVRRLSLFDTLEDDKALEKESVDLNAKAEPVLHEEEISDNSVEKSPELEDSNTDVDSEFKDEGISDDDISQENEEELLDIPTFLRRQAN